MICFLTALSLISPPLVTVSFESIPKSKGLTGCACSKGCWSSAKSYPPHLKAVPAYPEPSHGGECPLLFVKLCRNSKLISLKERHNYALWMTHSHLVSSRISNDSKLRWERPVGYWCSVNCAVQAKMMTALVSDLPRVRISIEGSQPIVRFNFHSSLLRWVVNPILWMQKERFREIMDRNLSIITN